MQPNVLISCVQDAPVSSRTSTSWDTITTLMRQREGCNARRVKTRTGPKKRYSVTCRGVEMWVFHVTSKKNKCFWPLSPCNCADVLSEKHQMLSVSTKISLSRDHLLWQVRDKLCDTCGAAFTNNQDLRQHIQIMHSGQRMYVCPVCGKDFSCVSLLCKLQGFAKSSSSFYFSREIL